MASLHALRRIFVDSIDNGRFSKTADSKSSEKKAEYVKWLNTQFASYQESLLAFVRTQEDPFSAPAIRTILEVSDLVQCDRFRLIFILFVFRHILVRQTRV